jgi:hypothetical protein
MMDPCPLLTVPPFGSTPDSPVPHETAVPGSASPTADSTQRQRVQRQQICSAGRGCLSTPRRAEEDAQHPQDSDAIGSSCHRIIAHL